MRPCPRPNAQGVSWYEHDGAVPKADQEYSR